MESKYNFNISSFQKLFKIEHNWFHIKRHFASVSKHLTYRKIKNLVSVEMQRRLKTPVIKGYPPFLKLEPTNLCNLKCPNCFTGSGADKRGKGMMDFDLYKKVIDEIGDYLIKINFYFWGEPFLHHRLFDMISYASERNIGSCVSTNFLIFSEVKAEKLLTSGLDHLIICFDGVDQKTYESYRKGGSYRKFIRNMEILSETRLKKNLYSTIIDVQFLVFDYNRDQIEEAKKLLIPFGFDRFTPKMNAEQKDPYDPSLFRPNVPCYWLWLVPTIGWDGIVTPCCDMPPHDFGDLNKHSFMEVFNGEQYVKARRLYKYDDPEKSKSICAFCHRGPNEKYKKKLAGMNFQGPRIFFSDTKRPWE